MAATDPPHLLPLADGRTLAYRVHGPADGRVVVHHHGGLVSGAYASLASDACHRLGIRLVSPDRPGIGSSSHRPGRVIRDLVDDVRQLLDHLGADRAGSIGWSMGGPYAVACALLLPDRVDGLVVVAGAVPYEGASPGNNVDRLDRFATALARRRPRLARSVFGAAAIVVRRVPGVVERTLAWGLSGDDAAVARSLPRGVLAGATAEGVAQPDGFAEDLRAGVRPWGVPVTRPRCPTTVMRGATDRVVGEVWATDLAGALDAPLVEVPRAGHLFLLADWDRVLAPLAG